VNTSAAGLKPRHVGSQQHRIAGECVFAVYPGLIVLAQWNVEFQRQPPGAGGAGALREMADPVADRALVDVVEKTRRVSTAATLDQQSRRLGPQVRNLDPDAVG
jgi:hypothetical protein